MQMSAVHGSITAPARASRCIRSSGNRLNRARPPQIRSTSPVTSWATFDIVRWHIIVRIRAPGVGL